MPDEIPLVSLEEDAYYQDPAGFFAWLRESQPVAPVRMPVRGRAWFITRYEDVWAALADPRLANDVHRWPGGARQRPSEAAGGVHAHLLNSDPPDHTRLRRLAWKAFTPRRVARLRPGPRRSPRVCWMTWKRPATSPTYSMCTPVLFRVQCFASCSASQRRIAARSPLRWPTTTSPEKLTE